MKQRLPYIALLLVIKIHVSVLTVNTASVGPCVFPFLYEGKSYIDCTRHNLGPGGPSWCATTADYDRDNKWRFCENDCQFPFLYANTVYTFCTRDYRPDNHPDDHPDNKLWCATTDNYDRDRKWSVCNHFPWSWNVSYSSQSICALEGSTVDMSCSYTHPSYLTLQKAYWINSYSGAAFDVSELPQFTDRVGVNCGKTNKNCSLRIHAVNYSDQGDYYCKVTTNVEMTYWIGANGVRLSVTDLKVVAPEVMMEGDHVTLTCSTTCTLTSNPLFIWSKDGHPVEKRQIINNQLLLHSISRGDEGNYTCAVQGYEDLPSPSERLSVMFSLPPEDNSIPMYIVTAALVCAVVALPCVFFWMRLCRAFENTQTTNNEDARHYVDGPHVGGDDATQMGSLYQSPNTIQPDAIYQSLNPDSTQPDGVYQSLNPNTIQPEAVYQSLNPKTTQPDAVYQSLNPNTTQPDAVYCV